MNKKFQHFFLRLTILSIIAGAIIYLVKTLVPSAITSPALFQVLILFFLLTAVVHYVLLRISTLNPRKFVGYFMLATFLKLFVYLIVMVVYAFTINREEVMPFVLGFFILYIIYTVFEVVSLLSQTKK
jgi:hypothetical protein